MGVSHLQVTAGTAARHALCAAIDHARHSITAEFYTLSDPGVVRALENAAERHVDVKVHVEARPYRFERRFSKNQAVRDRAIKSEAAQIRELEQRHVQVVLEDRRSLMHSKALVIDDAAAYIATCNPTRDGLSGQSDILMKDDIPQDVRAVKNHIEYRHHYNGRFVVGGIKARRDCVTGLLSSPHDVTIASEDLSDDAVVSALVARADHHHDRVLIGDRRSAFERYELARLRGARVEVRTLPFMHEKYIDDGERMYVGSANLTTNGLDEGHEIGIVAPAASAPRFSAALRAGFESSWASGIPA
jgi:phosphatidylserine/phosphatidylglycerophosphate/cardiolipin synthase-like enzyme